ncbi:MAG: hypothetical protein JRF33_20820, partial [Deltaproteobacteria bacterium]|nr:hypothetical protein [Deltaproteobacteria bacterium]
MIGIPLLVLALVFGGMKLSRMLDEGNEVEVPAVSDERPVPIGPVDLDATVRAMLELDAFVGRAESLDDYLARSARMDWRLVAEDVRLARRAILDNLEELGRIDAEDKVHDESWTWQRSLLSAARVLNLGGKASFTDVSLQAELDTAQAGRVSAEYAQYLMKGGQFSLRRMLAEARLKGLVRAYAESAYKHLKAWDALCAERDQAMLAALNGHHERAIQHASKAIEMSPFESEAHLILAMSLIEQGGGRLIQTPELPATEVGTPKVEAPDQSATAEFARAESLLAEFIVQHPERAAPARLLQGVLAGKLGQTGLARDRLDFASAHYPKHAAALMENFRSLQVRAKYLRKSSAGLRILRAQSALAQGAGYFSPDLQLAKLHFKMGDLSIGRKSILNHFARRRAQKNWEFILSDLQYAYRAFGADFRGIFPAESFLELLPAETWFGLGDKIKIELVNRSEQSLHNATLVLCARFTDMMPDDYATLGLNTLEEVPAGEEVAFGTWQPHFRVHGGKAKGEMIKDSLRAILVSDEAVVWVDTMAYRQMEHADVVRDMARGLARPELAIKWLAAEPEVLAGEVFVGSELRIQRNSVIKDELMVSLPAKVAVIRPLFRLLLGDDLSLKPDDARIESGKINLHFRLDLDGPEGLPETWTLVLISPFV